MKVNPYLAIIILLNELTEINSIQTYNYTTQLIDFKPKEEAKLKITFGSCYGMENAKNDIF